MNGGKHPLSICEADRNQSHKNLEDIKGDIYDGPV